MRAEIHDGPEHNTLQSEAGYIDARPPPPIRRNLLATHGRTIHLGQTEKNSVRAHVFRFALELGHFSTQLACLKRATSRQSDGDRQTQSGTLQRPKGAVELLKGRD